MPGPPSDSVLPRYNPSIHNFHDDDDNDDDANNSHDGDHDEMTLHVLLFMTTLQPVSFRG